MKACELDQAKGPDGKSCVDMVVEMHKALIGNYIEEGLISQIRKNTAFRKLHTWALSVLYTALVGGLVTNFVGGCDVTQKSNESHNISSQSH